MAVVSQSDFKRLVSMGYTIIDDAGIDLLSIHLPALSVSALGDDKADFAKALNDYITDLTEKVQDTRFRTEEHRKAAENHIKWLLTLGV